MPSSTDVFSTSSTRPAATRGRRPIVHSPFSIFHFIGKLLSNRHILIGMPLYGLFPVLQQEASYTHRQEFYPNLFHNSTEIRDESMQGATPITTRGRRTTTGQHSTEMHENVLHLRCFLYSPIPDVLLSSSCSSGSTPRSFNNNNNNNNNSIIDNNNSLTRAVPAAFPSASTRCSMCLSHFRESEVVGELPCQHCFHFGCIQAWLAEHSTCPLCRGLVRSESEIC